MNMDQPAGVMACPACIATPAAMSRAAKTVGAASVEYQFSLPTVHCAACIQTIETQLSNLPYVDDVRVNLTRKRATVHARPQTPEQDIISAISALGYEAVPLDSATLSAGETDRAARDLAMRLGVAGFAMMNVMLLSVAVWSGAADATRDLFHWLSALITLPTVLFSARPFYTSAWRVIRVGRLNMDVPITLAILLASGMSLFETISHGDHAYFDAALSLTFFLLAGRYLDQKMRSVARSAATELAAMEVPTALRMNGTDMETVAIQDVAVGDILMVQAGGKVPVDGRIISGVTDMDRSFLTGESDPVSVGINSDVNAGEINLSAPIQIQATAVGEDTLLHSLADLVSVAESAKSRYNSLADRAARIYAPAVHLLAVAAFVLWIWLTAGDVRVAMNIAVAVLIITCPCALGLAVPAVSTVASGRLFKSGILVKHATALERLAEIDAVVLDKTGTLTFGLPEMVTQLSDDDLAIAAGIARQSAHPRSKAIVQAAGARGVSAATVTDITEEPGMGLQGRHNGQTVRLGRAVWVGCVSSTMTVLQIGTDVHSLEFRDSLRDGAADLIRAFKTRGIPVSLLSGDVKMAVDQVADELGIDNRFHEMLPQDKIDFLNQCTQAGQKVLMIGDGLNDVGALSVAHVSIAPASALEATRVAADMVLVSPDLRNVFSAIGTARSARARILENFAVAAVYNMIAVPIAFAGFATPLAAAIAMSTSSIIVSLNALRTR